jgi:hypothetical protein
MMAVSTLPKFTELGDKKMASQKLNQKKCDICSRIVGQPVISAFANGDGLPHYVYLAFTSGTNAFLVNIRRKGFRQYVKDGKFVMKRVRKEIKYS